MDTDGLFKQSTENTFFYFLIKFFKLKLKIKN